MCVCLFSEPIEIYIDLELFETINLCVLLTMRENWNQDELRNHSADWDNHVFAVLVQTSEMDVHLVQQFATSHLIAERFVPREHLELADVHKPL